MKKNGTLSFDRFCGDAIFLKRYIKHIRHFEYSVNEELTSFIVFELNIYVHRSCKQKLFGAVSPVFCQKIEELLEV